MSMDVALTRLPACPLCGEGVSDHEPRVSSAKYEGQSWHPTCVAAHLAERYDLFTRRLEKSVRRQTWMTEAWDLLLQSGISANLTQWARAAFEDGKTPTEFLALVKDEKVAV